MASYYSYLWLLLPIGIGIIVNTYPDVVRAHPVWTLIACIAIGSSFAVIENWKKIWEIRRLKKQIQQLQKEYDEMEVQHDAYLRRH